MQKFHNSFQEAVTAAGQNIQVGSPVGFNQTFQTIAVGQTGGQDMIAFNEPPDIKSARGQRGGWRVSFYSNEPDRYNVHVTRGTGKTKEEAVFWVETDGHITPENVVFKKGNKNFRPHDEGEARKAVVAKLGSVTAKLKEVDESKKPRTVKSTD